MCKFVDKNFLRKNILVFCNTSPWPGLYRRRKIYFACPIVFYGIRIRIPGRAFWKFEAAVLIGIPGGDVIVFIEPRAMNVVLWRMEEVMTNYIVSCPTIFYW